MTCSDCIYFDDCFSADPLRGSYFACFTPVPVSVSLFVDEEA